MKLVRNYVHGNYARCASESQGALNYGLQGGKLMEYNMRNPRVCALPTLNARQHGSKYNDVVAVGQALRDNPITACFAPVSATGDTLNIPTDGTWILKPYWSLGGKDIEVYTGQSVTS